jgi:hypothetical protein
MTRYADYCPISAGVEVLGDRWTPLVIRELMVGASAQRSTLVAPRNKSQPEHESTDNPGRNRGTYIVARSLAEDK